MREGNEMCIYLYLGTGMPSISLSLLNHIELFYMEILLNTLWDFGKIGIISIQNVQ